MKIKTLWLYTKNKLKDKSGKKPVAGSGFLANVLPIVLAAFGGGFSNPIGALVGIGLGEIGATKLTGTYKPSGIGNVANTIGNIFGNAVNTTVGAYGGFAGKAFGLAGIGSGANLASPPQVYNSGGLNATPGNTGQAASQAASLASGGQGGSGGLLPLTYTNPVGGNPSSGVYGLSGLNSPALGPDLLLRNKLF